MKKNESLVRYAPVTNFYNYSFIIPERSEKIQILVDALRLVSLDDEIRSCSLYIPDDCEEYGFSDGYHDLSVLLHFLADMLEE